MDVPQGNLKFRSIFFIPNLICDLATSTGLSAKLVCRLLLRSTTA